MGGCLLELQFKVRLFVVKDAREYFHRLLLAHVLLRKGAHQQSQRRRRCLIVWR